MADEFLNRLDDLERERYLKVKRLRERGAEPYPLRSARTHTSQEARELFERGEDPGAVRLTGRLTANRWNGKITFADLRDGAGRIQLFIRQDALGEATYKEFIKDFDLGDIIGVEGTIMRTRTGEISVAVTKIEMLSKAIAPMPEKWHGLKDIETRYRQRYLDLMSNEEVRRVFVVRAKTVSAMRQYLDGHGFIEVETPTLQPLYGGAMAKPFVTHHNELDRDLYLRIATELYLKRLLVGGFERVYEIGKNFRNEGVDKSHLPEFTGMECYQAYADYNDMIRLVEEVYRACAEAAIGALKFPYQGNEIDLSAPWQRVTMHDAILEMTGVDIDRDTDLESLRARIKEKGLAADVHPSWGKTVEELFSSFVQPKIVQPTFLLDFPAEVSPLAKKKPENPRIAERFEPYIAGMEVGNAFTELNDPEDQFLNFLDQQRQRAAGDVEAQQMDEDYVQALKHGLPPTGGLGLGVDRMAMLFTDQHSIRDVVLYPQLRT
ncbi:MAG: lysine--tRNA ligase [Anaerolineae bacterium]